MENGDRARNRHRSRREAKKLLEDYYRSGLRQRDWCQQRGIGIASLHYWIRREKEEKTSYSLVPVEIESGSGGCRGLELEIKGLCFRVGAGSDLRALAGLLKELQ